MFSQLLLKVPSSKYYQHMHLELKFPTHGILVSKVKQLQVGSTKLNICKHRYYHVPCTPVREKGTWHSFQLVWPRAPFLEHSSYGPPGLWSSTVHYVGSPAVEALRAAKAPVTKAQTSLGLRWFDFKTLCQPGA